MKIAGGAYHEICREPMRNEFFGSGLRAAIAISRAVESLELVTIATPEEETWINSLGKSFRFSARVKHRKNEIVFSYDTPLSPPILSPTGIDRVKLTANDETVLAFGMPEGGWSITGKSVIIDPQGASSIDHGVKWSGERSALVCNQLEVRTLAGATNSRDDAANSVRKKYGFDTVVVKCGGLGAVVYDGKAAPVKIGVYPTNSIYPIGSGDVFTSIFACCWGNKNMSAVESARHASLGAAVWVSQGPLQVVDKDGNIVNPDLLNEMSFRQTPRIYLAGPFFSIGQRWIINTFRNGLIDLGAEVLSPMHDVGFGVSSEVAHEDLKLISNANGLLAVLDDLDAGTLFEVGFAKAREIPIVAYASHCSDDDLTMVTGTEVSLCSDMSTAVYRAVWESTEPRLH
ncbi:MAG: PfkB family carbohydrate kinase [Dehalococcoidales bacterium]|jgi:hypothetical protein